MGTRGYRGVVLSQWGLVLGIVGALHLHPMFSGSADACPIENKKGKGLCTRSYVRDGTFVKCNNRLKSKVTTTSGTNWCKSTLDIDIPKKGGYVIWAAAAPDGATGIFFGNSATGKWVFTKGYSVGCGPCPAGTPIKLDLGGSAKYVQYAAAVGAFRILGSASSTVKGEIQVDPFPGSVYDVSATPATVTAKAGFGTSSAGSTSQQVVPITDSTTQACPLENQTIRLDLAVTASRTGGATSSTASYDAVNLDITSNCSCGKVVFNDESTVLERVKSEGQQQMTHAPWFASGLGLLETISVQRPEALAVTDDGRLLMASTDTRPGSLSNWQANGPRTVVLAWNGIELEPLSQQRFGLVSALIPDGEGALAIEQAVWDRTLGNFAGTVASRVDIDLRGGVTEVPYDVPLALPSAAVRAYPEGGPAADLLLALPDEGSLVTVDVDGNVGALPTTMDLGTPVDLAWGAKGSAFDGEIVVVDVGSAGDDAILHPGTGRLLAVDPATGGVRLIAAGLDAPVAVAFAEASVSDVESGEPLLLVVEAGVVDPTTGARKPASGRVVAYDSDGSSSTQIADLEDPVDVAVAHDGNWLVATRTGVLRVGPVGSVSVGHPTSIR